MSKWKRARWVGHVAYITGWEGIGWIYLVQERDKCQDLRELSHWTLFQI